MGTCNGAEPEHNTSPVRGEETHQYETGADRTEIRPGTSASLQTGSGPFSVQMEQSSTRRYSLAVS